MTRRKGESQRVISVENEKRVRGVVGDGDLGIEDEYIYKYIYEYI